MEESKREPITASRSRAVPVGEAIMLVPTEAGQVVNQPPTNLEQVDDGIVRKGAMEIGEIIQRSTVERKAVVVAGLQCHPNFIQYLIHLHAREDNPFIITNGESMGCQFVPSSSSAYSSSYSSSS